MTNRGPNPAQHTQPIKAETGNTGEGVRRQPGHLGSGQVGRHGEVGPGGDQGTILHPQLLPPPTSVGIPIRSLSPPPSPSLTSLSPGPTQAPLQLCPLHLQSPQAHVPPSDSDPSTSHAPAPCQVPPPGCQPVLSRGHRCPRCGPAASWRGPFCWGWRLRAHGAQ